MPGTLPVRNSARPLPTLPSLNRPPLTSDPARDPAWESALNGLLRRFRNEIAAVGARLRLSAEEQDALVQDLRIRLWRSAPAPENLGELGPSYLVKTAKWVALDLLRARRKGEVSETPGGAPVPEAPPRDRPDGALEQRRLAQAIQGAAETLAPDRRTVVALWLAGYDRHEIARLVGWGEARTRNLLYRGLGDLRAALKEQGITPEGATLPAPPGEGSERGEDPDDR